jgi:hypothetical protein
MTVEALMSDTPVMPKLTAQQTEPDSRGLSQEDLRDFKHVTNGLIQEAINVWDELWAELDGTDESAALVKLETGFEPSCGWTEFLQKMWTLRHTLDFVKRYSRESSETL